MSFARSVSRLPEGTILSQAVSGGGHTRIRRLGGLWPLPAVLAVQAGLSLRLLRADTASQAEALYLRAGHEQWAHWLHGAALPQYSSYFSGSPTTRRPGRWPTAPAGWPARARCP